MKYVHIYTKDILLVTNTLGTNFSGSETVFNRIKRSELGEIAHILNHSYGNCTLGGSDKTFHEGSMWTENNAVISFIFKK